MKLDQGAIDYQKGYLNWCTIVAPISGRTGIRLVDQGNIVHASDVTGIVVLTTLQPISVLFTLPQQQLSQVNKALTRGPLSAEAVNSDNKDVLDRGTLQVVNNQVDQTTGTVQFKAEFPNGDQQLWPGQFVNARLLVDTLRHVVGAERCRAAWPERHFRLRAQSRRQHCVRPLGQRHPAG